MKKCFIRTVSAICVAVMLLGFPSQVSTAQHNDEKYDSYINMNISEDGDHARYVIPNLYRQDASYTNIKTFPLVVNEGVEYFPLDIFALYPYLEVVYSKIAYGFYINNTKNSHYVAFDIESGVTTTHDGQLTDVKAKIFNHTYYVPASVVCKVLEMNFESYDDEENGIRAARISDSKAKMTLPQLVAAYSPVKNPQPEIINPEVPEIVSPPEQTAPEITDPFKNAAGRSVCLTFDNILSGNADEILTLLSEKNVKAIFFADKNGILSSPDIVRRIVAEGHCIGIMFYPRASDADILPNKQILEQISEANEALNLVAKIKTRYIRAEYGYAHKLESNGFGEFASHNGYVLYDWNIDARDSDTYRNSQFDSLIDGIMNLRPSKSGVSFIRFSSRKGTAQLLSAYFEFCDKYPQFKVFSVDEYTEPMSFISD